MDWGTLVATVSGGSIAITGTVLADYLRHRREDDRGIGAQRRAVYIEFITAAGICHARLRHLAQDPGGESDMDALSRAAMSEAGVYEARERLFIDATAAVAGAGQAMFEQLRAVRQAVAAGASITSTAFHDAYHPYIGAVWRYRVAVREELEGRSLSPAAFGWEGWDGTDRCPICRSAAALAP
ncbi:CchlQ [Streptomyces agglomeratus]|uniref:CchlQ n=1 Tax=Streptomyces agglomeratus TaxID=285458 RepID=A0A1E5P2D5_9ACTN|nr:CchlQ [Streptomyces agglomeratus]OEJ23690.1 CchlQ [Streptomyces agglomeratus]OEJ43282.1 CchlQ [Streptomyces agglomeratus]OEJ54798.1 CchlQ [Streptomyces agglomeratus]